MDGFYIQIYTYIASMKTRRHFGLIKGRSPKMLQPNQLLFVVHSGTHLFFFSLFFNGSYCIRHGFFNHFERCGPCG